MPDGLTIQSTALIVVDVQNDFADPAGSLSVAGGEAVVDVVNTHIDDGGFSRRARRLHAGLASADRRRTSPRTAASGRSTAWPTAGAPRCTRGSRSSGPSSTRASAARTATRASPAATRALGLTSPTDLEVILRSAASNAWWSCGLATDYCILATVLDALDSRLRDDRPERRDRRRRPAARRWRAGAGHDGGSRGTDRVDGAGSVLPAAGIGLIKDPKARVTASAGRMASAPARKMTPTTRLKTPATTPTATYRR